MYTRVYIGCFRCFSKKTRYDLETTKYLDKKNWSLNYRTVFDIHITILIHFGNTVHKHNLCLIEILTGKL